MMVKNEEEDKPENQLSIISANKQLHTNWNRYFIS